MSIVSDKVQIESHIGRRIEALRRAAEKHIDATVGATKIEIQALTGAARELIGLKPVQAAGVLVGGTLDAADKLIFDNLDASIVHVKEQASITREGRA